MEELSERELLLLDNFMYCGDSANEGKTIRGILKDVHNSDGSWNIEDLGRLSGGFETEEGGEDFKKVLDEIYSSNTLCSLRVAKSIDGGVRASCFEDPSGNAVVAIRDTGGIFAAWFENFKGGYQSDTAMQKDTEEFIKSLKYDHITVTGHSKGGNLGMYVTVTCGDKIDRCVSFDGQGFGKDFLQKYESEISDNKNKIKSISAHNDFVNIILTVKRQTTTNSNIILFLLLVSTVRQIIPAKSLYQ